MKHSILFLLAFSAALFSVHAKVRFVVSGNYVVMDDSNTNYLNYVRYMTVPFASQSGAAWDAGNDVSGKTDGEIQTIVNNIKALETDPVQQEIYTAMQSCPTEWFTFRSVTHAKNIVLQRLKTIEMMKAFNLDLRYAYHSSSHPPSTTASRWTTGKPTKFFFRQISGTAFAAINELCASTTKTYGECHGAIVACIWWGAAQGMAESPFDTLYPTSTSLNMYYKASNAYARNLAAATDTSTLIPGDWVYFKNFNYTEVVRGQPGSGAPSEDPHGFYKSGLLDGDTIYYWAGENAMYCGKDESGNRQFEGLGVQSRPEGAMKQAVAGAYNADLADVIKKAAKTGGLIGGLEVTEITTDPEINSKISIINIKRLTHDE